MSKKGPVLATAVQDDKSQPRLYAPWMIGVMVVFGVCEGLFFAWGKDATAAAMMGLIFMAAVGVARCLRVFGKLTTLKGLCVFAAFLFLTALVLFPEIQAASTAARRSHCTNKMRQLALGVMNYESCLGHWPAAFQADESGQPMHSWRVRLLPWLESMDESHEQYDFEKPWDSPENRKILEGYTPMWFYYCPGDRNPHSKEKGVTNYVAVLGEDTFWRPDGTPRAKDEVKVDLSSVPVLIGISNSDILWYEPRDMKLDDFLTGKISWSKSAVHGGWNFLYEDLWSRNIAFADGSIRFTRGEMTPEQLRRFFSITEPFDIEKELPYESPRPLVFRHIVLYIWLATLLVQFVYIFFPTRRKV
ncbi:MAG: DUF1559 domain-containing protein [Planctomycetia bacterium]|jgi:hypothetical protein